LVVAPAEIRIQRVMERDQAAREQVIDRINKQWSDEQKMQLADFVIDNSGQVPVLPQVLSLHRQFLELANTVGKN
jgi:dephospho-CoA kinase